MKYWNEFLSLLLGWHQYRVRFDYLVNGRLVFSVTESIAIKEMRLINDHRLLKKEFGPIASIEGIHRHMLGNGTLNMEPVCYLGRWKKAHNTHKRQDWR